MSDAIRPVMLVILDGWGWREDEDFNAIRLAHTPTFDRLQQAHPHAFLKTSGLDVGLPRGQMGNSEVGHLNIGAGRVVMQDLPRIGQAIEDGSLARNPALLDLIARLRESGGTCHLIGLVSDGGVHSHQDHAIALSRILVAAGVPVRLHVFTDGRDTPPNSAQGYIHTIRMSLPEGAKIGSVSGRYYAMDRDNRWERVQKAYCTIVDTVGPHFADAASAVDAAYANSVTDEFIVPAVINGFRGMRDGDGLLCFNFRSDRVRELMTALLDPEFDGFARPRVVNFAAAVSMTSYSHALDKLMRPLFLPIPMHNLLGQVVAAAGRAQIRMAETEKYPHVTYFFNGGEEIPNPGEDRVMAPSPKVATYDLKPEMSADELTDKAIAAIESGTYDLIVLNFANPDMVGHTGVLNAVIRAVETVDADLGRILAAVERQGGAVLVTADHGNAEQMKNYETGGPHTAHTTNPVPVMLFGAPGQTLHDGRLADIAPTLLALLGIPQPPEMTGRSLLGPA